jgi:hypothetical protein
MNFEEKLGLLERGLKRRVENYPKYVESGKVQQEKVQKFVDEFNRIIEVYKNDYKVRKQLQNDKSLIAMAGSKSKLKKLLENEVEFVKMVETGRDEYLKNYGQEIFRIQMMLDEAKEGLPDAEYLLKLIAHNNYDEKMLDSFMNLFLLPVLTDWKQYEEDLKKQEQENIQDNIQDSE